jgi:hypothetical protein
MILYYLTIIIIQHDLDENLHSMSTFSWVLKVSYGWCTISIRSSIPGYDGKISKKGEESVGEDESVRAWDESNTLILHSPSVSHPPWFILLVTFGIFLIDSMSTVRKKSSNRNHFNKLRSKLRENLCVQPQPIEMAAKYFECNRIINHPSSMQLASFFSRLQVST